MEKPGLSVAPSEESEQFSLSATDTLDYLFSVAQSLERRGDSSDALSAYEEMFKYDQGSEFVQQKILGLARNLNRPSSIIGALQQGRKMADLPDSTLRDMAKIYAEFEANPLAILSLLSIDSKLSTDSLALMYLFESDKKYDEAIAYHTELFNELTPADELYLANLYRYSLNIEECEIRYSALLKDSTLSSDIEERAVYGLAIVLLNTKRSDSARVLLENLLDQEAGSQTFYMTRELLAEYYVGTSEYSKAIEYYSQLTTLTEGREISMKFYRNVGYYSFINGNFSQSKSVFEDIILDSSLSSSSYINLAETYYLYGASLEKSDDLGGAEQAYKTALLVDASFIEAKRSLVILYLHSERIDEAQTEALDLTLVAPESLSGWALSGAISAIRTEYDDAVHFYSRALEIDSTNTNIMEEYAMTLSRVDSTSMAIETLEKLMQIDPSNANNANFLGYLYAQNDINLVEAQRLVTIAVRADSTNGAYLDSYGWVLYRQGKYELALEYLHKALEHIEPMDYEVYLHIAEVNQTLKKYDIALYYYQLALDVENADKLLVTDKIADLKAVMSVESTPEKSTLQQDFE